MAQFWSCMYFHFRSMRNRFINKVTRVHRAMTVAKNISLCSTILVVFLEFIPSTGLKFPIWTHHRIRPGNRASPVTGLIWRGPETTSIAWIDFLSGQSGSSHSSGSFAIVWVAFPYDRPDRLNIFWDEWDDRDDPDDHMETRLKCLYEACRK